MIKIYALQTMRDGHPVYIGQTGGTLALRLSGHLSASRGGSGTLVHRWIRAQVAKPVIVLIEQVGEHEGDAAEHRWIVRGVKEGWGLLNTSLGGGRVTKEQRLKMRLAKLGKRGNRQGPLSDDHKCALSIANKGFKPVGIGARGRLGKPGEVNPMRDPRVVAKMMATKKRRRLEREA